MPVRNIDQFTTIIKAKIAKYANRNTVSEEGKVISVGDGIANVVGLDNVMLNELVEFENGTYGMALNLETDMVGVVLLGDYDNIAENSVVKRTQQVISVPVGDQLLGRIIDPLGVPIDGKAPLRTTKTMPIEKVAPALKNS
jgi:F-type H+-transporting ATPase subunit alpha